MLLSLTLDNGQLDILFFLQLSIVKKMICPGRSVPKKWRPSKYKYNFQLWGNTIGSLNQERGDVQGVALTLCKQEKSTSCLLIQADLPCPPCLDIRDHSWQAGHWFTTWLENFNENSTAPVSWIRSPDMLSCLCKVSQHGSRLLIYHPRWPAFIR